MKKAYSLTLEVAALRTICDPTNPASQYLLSRLTDNSFASEIGNQAFARILEKYRTDGSAPKWKFIISDTALNDEIKEYLETKDIEPITDKKSVVSLIRKLNEYSKQRNLIRAGKIIEKAFRSSDGLNADELIYKVQRELAGAAKTTDLRLLRIGGKNSNAVKHVKKVLSGEAFEFIPTGFKGFDDINRGLPKGCTVLLAGPTGGGKSALVGQLARNMAMSGACVGIWGLEMTPEQIFRRDISAVSNRKSTDFFDPLHRISKSDRNGILEMLETWDKKISKAGGEIIYPELIDKSARLTMDQLLALSKPYKFDVNIIDYVGLVAPTHKDMWISLGDALMSAINSGKSDNCINIVCAQIDDEMKVRYARQMEEHAPICWKWKWTPESKMHGITEIVQSKARFVSPCSFSLKFEFETMNVRDATDSEKEQAKTRSKDAKKRWSKDKEDEDWIDGEDANDSSSKPKNQHTKSKNI